MTIELLIHAIVRQTTILIGQLATSGGARAPLARVATQVFLDLVRELERQGVSRKVSADMFGMGLRTYQRKIQRYTESSTERGQSLWVAVFDYIRNAGVARRADVLLHFSEDDESLVRGVLHDLCESGLVAATGVGAAQDYQATPEHELARLRQTRRSEGIDELIWALIYREGPLTMAELSDHGIDASELEAALTRLVSAGRVEYSENEGAYRTRTLLVPFGAPSGWEAAVFDHFNSLVSTILCKLRESRSPPQIADRVGGSTYSVEVWPGHPNEEEAYATLARLRAELSGLRRRIGQHNATHPKPAAYDRLIVYVGQCVIPQGVEEDAQH